MARGRTTQVMVRRVDGRDRGQGPDRLIVEEPLEIRLDGHRVATTMRTPGHDFELAVGWCLAEGLLAGAPVRRVAYCGESSAIEGEFNVVDVDTGGIAPEPAPRLTSTTSACGLCGSTQVAELRARLQPRPSSVVFDPAVITAVPDRVRETQALFDATGGVHAAAAFTGAGDLRVVREDIGRHNAVDKVVGHLQLAAGLPTTALGLFVSGRASFEIVQKAWAAGFAAVVAVSAPSSMAVEAARAGGVQLYGFVRERRMNVYVERSPGDPNVDSRSPGDRNVDSRSPGDRTVER